MKNRINAVLSLVFEKAEALPSLRMLKQTNDQQNYLDKARRVLAISLMTLALPTILGHSSSVFAKPRRKVENLTAQYSLDRNVDNLDGAAMRIKLLEVLSRPATRLFLDVVQKAEGGELNIMVGGCRAQTVRLHPALTLPRSCRHPIWISGRLQFSTASGNYQITFSNWKQLAPFLGLPDFSETSQALAALEFIRRGGGAANAFTPRGLATKQRIQRGFIELLKGNVSRALCLATYDWASSSCSPLPAANKVDYVRLAKTMHKKTAPQLGRMVPSSFNRRRSRSL